MLVLIFIDLPIGFPHQPVEFNESSCNARDTTAFRMKYSIPTQRTAAVFGGIHEGRVEVLRTTADRKE